MAETTVSTTSAIAKKSWSETLSYMCGREPTPLKSLTGPMPTEDEALRKMSQQTTNWMPVVRVDELTKTAGDRVQVDCAQIAKFIAIMGDENAEGRGPDLNYSSQELVLNMATLPVSAGGKMSQQRTVHDLRKRAIKELADVTPLTKVEGAADADLVLVLAHRARRFLLAHTGPDPSICAASISSIMLRKSRAPSIASFIARMLRSYAVPVFKGPANPSCQGTALSGRPLHSNVRPHPASAAVSRPHPSGPCRSPGQSPSQWGTENAAPRARRSAHARPLPHHAQQPTMCAPRASAQRFRPPAQPGAPQ